MSSKAGYTCSYYFESSYRSTLRAPSHDVPLCQMEYYHNELNASVKFIMNSSINDLEVT